MIRRRPPRKQIKKHAEYQYNLHANILHKIAWSFTRSHNLEFEEILGELRVIFMECIKNYKPGTKFSTYLYRSCENKCKNYVRNLGINKNKRLEVALNEVTEEDRVILIDQLTNNPDEIVNEITKIVRTQKLPKGSRLFYGWLDKKLNKLGYKYSDIWNSFKTYKQILKGG